MTEIDDDSIWNICIEYLPKLKIEVEQLLINL